jgi:hypothetical protein
MTNDAWNGLRIAAAMIIPTAIGTALVYLAAVVFQDYGWTLFILHPIFLGFTSTIIYSPKGTKGLGKCLLVSLGSIVVIGILIMVTAIEGLVCLLMVLPLAVPLIAIGSAIAWIITRQIGRSFFATLASICMVITMPFLLGFETSAKSTPTVHQVVSTIEIDAPIEKVWRVVIAFPEIEQEPEGILRLGFAYPISADIQGTGPGATRHCNFNTGTFVEPITTWQEPNLLAFDVKEQPASMIETSPYEHLHAAHLDYLRSQRGQFRLFEKDGKTIVEGTTFYTHDIAPDIYWRLFSDEIIHQIHMRVLNHIKRVSES